MNNHQSTIIIQARMTSSRLPGKVLQDMGGEPMLARVVRRARRAQTAGLVAVATTTDPSDDPVEAFCRRRGYPVFRGSLHDVLDRYYQAALAFDAQTVVRLTADCPVIDPGVIDGTVRAFFGCPPTTRQVLSDGYGHKLDALPGAPTAAYDFAANRLPPPWQRTYPIGLDTEVVAFAALAQAWRDAKEKYEREHVMPYFYDQEGRFRIVYVNDVEDNGSMRWTVDTPEDLELLRQVYATFGNRDDFTWLEVLDLFHRRPELAQINAQVRHKTLTEVDERSAPPRPEV